jgi:hypothetical protein
MEDSELEEFCRQFAERRSGYFEVKRFGGAGDKGRDVVGFCTSARHDGEWDNYQCKQYRTKLGKSEGLLAVGKVLYWASRQSFTVPRYFYFVAPKGLAGPLLDLVNSPASCRKALVESWGPNCAKKIIANTTIPMDSELEQAINEFDFANVKTLDVDEILTDPAATPLLVELFGHDPGQYPAPAIPVELQPEEIVYLQALHGAYNERESGKFASHDEIFSDAKHGEDMRVHRSRFYEADGFQKFYRDNSSPETIAAFRKEIYFGVRDKLKEDAKDQLARVDSTMAHAATIMPAGPLAKYGSVPVRQGVVHHLVNDGDIDWKGSK